MFFFELKHKGSTDATSARQGCDSLGAPVVRRGHLAHSCHVGGRVGRFGLGGPLGAPVVRRGHLAHSCHVGGRVGRFVVGHLRANRELGGATMRSVEVWHCGQIVCTQSESFAFRGWGAVIGCLIFWVSFQKVRYFTGLISKRDLQDKASHDRTSRYSSRDSRILEPITHFLDLTHSVQA